MDTICISYEEKENFHEIQLEYSAPEGGGWGEYMTTMYIDGIPPLKFENTLIRRYFHDLIGTLFAYRCTTALKEMLEEIFYGDYTVEII